MRHDATLLDAYLLQDSVVGKLPPQKKKKKKKSYFMDLWWGKKDGKCGTFFLVVDV